MLKRPLLSAVLLTILTWVILAVLKTYLPYGPTGAAIFDSLAVPGAVIASIAYPQGIHSRHGAPGWVWLVICSNLVVYVLVWYAVLKLVAWRRDRQGPDHGGPEATTR